MCLVGIWFINGYYVWQSRYPNSPLKKGSHGDIDLIQVGDFLCYLGEKREWVVINYGL